MLAEAASAGLASRWRSCSAHQTIEELAAAAAGRSGEAAGRADRPLELVTEEDRRGCRRTVEDAYPLVDLQAGMLFHSALSPETAVYHDVFSSRMRGRLDEARLRGRWAGCCAVTRCCGPASP